jgi:hypothetical protein
MTRCPTTFESHVWKTPSTLVKTAIAINPRTRIVSSWSSFFGSALSKMSRTRNGETMLRSAEMPMSVRTAPSRQRYGLKSAKTRWRFARRTAGSAGRSGASLDLNRPSMREDMELTVPMTSGLVARRAYTAGAPLTRS